jgi:hypothetical protein
MTTRWRAMVAAALAIVPAIVEAQVYTLDSVVTHVEAAVQQANAQTPSPTLLANLNAVRNVLRADPEALKLGLDDLAAIITRTKPSASTIARWNPQLLEYAARPGFRALLLQLVNVGSTAIRQLVATLPPAELRDLEAPIDRLQTLVLQMNLVQNETKLQRYEMKYGPKAPALNAVEVVVNAAAQWLPTFGPDANGWPGPNEFILAYRTAELAVTERGDSAKLVSVGQVGMRRYLWNQSTRTDNRLLRILRPGHASLGMAITSSSDKPLVRPWGAGNRLGAFLGYGDIHAAYLFEKPRRILVGTGKQFIPYAF